MRACAVAFMDPKFSIVEIVRAIGRALRQNPGEGRTATVIVPVFLAPGERPDDMLVSDSYHPLVRTLHALAAHDARVLDMLATPAPSGPKTRTRAIDIDDTDCRTAEPPTPASTSRTGTTSSPVTATRTTPASRSGSSSGS